jgi:pullulanase
VNYAKVNYSKAPYASQPWHTVSYCECHDNHVLWDKLSISAAESSPAQRREMHKLALTTVLTSQGISFIHAGTEFLRTKYGVENSFNAGDSINRINWDLKTLNKDVNEYVRELIRMRKNHPAFRMMHATEIAGNLQFMEESPENVVAYTINGAAVRDSWKKIMVLLNGNTRSTVMPLPAGNWTIHIRDNAVAGDKKTVSGSVPLAASAATILYQE